MAKDTKDGEPYIDDADLEAEFQLLDEKPLAALVLGYASRVHYDNVSAFVDCLDRLDESLFQFANDSTDTHSCHAVQCTVNELCELRDRLLIDEASAPGCLRVANTRTKRLVQACDRFVSEQFPHLECWYGLGTALGTIHNIGVSVPDYVHMNKFRRPRCMSPRLPHKTPSTELAAPELEIWSPTHVYRRRAPGRPGSQDRIRKAPRSAQGLSAGRGVA
jgi:hypothetical protein